MTGFAAIDLGASSGRVMWADVTPERVALTEVHRFPNRPVTVAGRLHWDVLALWAGILDGLRTAVRQHGPVAGIAIDSWAIDYGLLDGDGRLLGNPVHYRDGRTAGVAEQVDQLVSAEELYRRTGVQRLPFNTIYQLAAGRDDVQVRYAEQALLIPDLFGYWLTGNTSTELTNASTTGLLDITGRHWDEELFQRLNLPVRFPPVAEPDTVLGPVLPTVAAEAGLDGGSGTPLVTLVGSHDTASAVVGVPASGKNFAYISCGTWSLVGVEAPAPVTTEAARAANFSNELGLDGSVRFLKNVMGLWLLQECVRTWQRGGRPVELAELLTAAERVPAGRFVVDPDRPEFLPPGDMPARLQAECRRLGGPNPQTQAELTRCVLDSLAQAYRRVVRQAAELSGVDVEVVHLVGGGTQNSLLCQLAADACGLPVVAGPVEAAAVGNVLVQARTAGVLSGSLAELRGIPTGAEPITFYPRNTA